MGDPHRPGHGQHSPSVADVLAVGFLVPGAWALVSTIRGRLSRAEEIAVYLDDASLLVAIVAVLATVAGSAAMASGGLPGLLMVLYPSLFLGAGGIALVGLLADRSPLRDGAGLATGVGALLIGVAYVGWAVPAAIGARDRQPVRRVLLDRRPGRRLRRHLVDGARSRRRPSGTPRRSAAQLGRGARRRSS